MRIFTNFKEALGEIKRDLAEMGTNVTIDTMQDKYVAGNPDFQTLELQNYCYTVIDPVSSWGDLSPTQPWADLEFMERINRGGVNPGEAYLHRSEVWEEFLHDGKFSYSYSERMCNQLDRLISELIDHPGTRQAFLSIWDPNIDLERTGGIARVPCTLGYLFQARGGKLNMTYFMRSCDFATHMQNDMYLSTKLQEYVSLMTGYPVGNFTHIIGSLHIYRKDCEGVF